MKHITHNIFLLMLNLSQIRNRNTIISVFLDAMNSIQNKVSLSFFEKEEKSFDDFIEICTINYSFGKIVINGNSKDLPEDLRGILQNAVQMLAVILENRKRAELLSDEKLVLEEAVKERTLELEKSEKKYRYLVEKAHEGIWVIDNNEKTTLVNPKICEILGYSREEMMDKDIFSFMDDKGVEICKENLERRKKGIEESYNFEFIHKNGKRVYTRTSTSPVIDDKGKHTGSLAMISDITEEKKNREKLVRLFRAIEQSRDIIVITDKNAAVEYVNPAFEEITGYEKEEALGKNIDNLLDSGQNEEVNKKKWEIISQGLSWTGRKTCRRKDGTLYKSEISISPIMDNSENITNYVSVERDVTEQVRLEQQLRQSRKMEAIGTLAGGIAHDFNNILGAIIGYAELALDDSAPGTILHANLIQLLKSGHRAKDLVRQILTFSRQKEEIKGPLEITDSVTESMKLIRALLPSTIEISCNITDKKLVVMADKTEIHQVMLNLCANGAHAMREEGGTLKVSVREFEVTPKISDLFDSLEIGPYVKFTVSDTGCGMDKSVMDRIFEPYFTTKETGEGTGMGLSLVHGIVKRIGGDISVHSEPGKGSIFQIFLPVLKEPDKENGGDGKTSFAGGNERILLIDDEKDIIYVTKRRLEKLGYLVTVQSSSVEGLEFFQREPENFDLIITDQTMPHMSGLNLAKRIKSVRADIPIILCSGYAEQAEKEPPPEISAFLLKPLDLSTIAKTIRKVLENKKRG